MLFFTILFKTILSLNFEMAPNNDEVFYENIKAGVQYRLEYSTDSGDALLCNIIDNRGRIIGEWNTSYTVVHFKAEDDMSFTLTFKNLNNKAVKLKLQVPDLDNESTDAVVTSAANIQSVYEFERRLKSIILKTTDYTERMNIFSEKMNAYKWKIRIFMGLELIFCGCMIYFLHRDTVRLFDRRRKV
ncbi:hypothetical protein M153_110003497 [Pseudoloma neurophilia]|uniref:GOLD domain-containing protein n=1 Tax=Pseudoloma neurophilia TaxID=146866 RepID=A0A0R0M1D3_9MICR|nr:hypothetical protein M153_110003497 [Pseudoloma neurophilia]